MTAADKKLMKGSDRCFWLCWAAYFSTYLGRLDYTACLIAITAEKGMSKGNAGIISTMFFICYGAGQLFSGIAGDKLRPQNMVFCGLVGGAACNLIFPILKSWQWMAFIWGANGVVQSFIWSPIIRILAESYDEPKRSKLCIAMNTAVPLGTLCAYLLAAIFIKTDSWILCFYAGAVMMAAASGIWMLGMKKVHETAVLQVKKEVETRSKKIENGKIFLSSGIPIVCFVLMLQGMLKDGVITWVPVYIGEVYSLSLEKAVLGTAILPVINLSGVYLAHQLNQKLFRNELSTAGALFGGTAICMGLMWLSLGMGPVYSIVLLAVSTTLMMGVNTLLASVIPVYFSKYQKSSSAAGLLNSSVYAGCAISSYGIGVLAELLGWDLTVAVWGLAAVTGILASLGAALKWRKFRLEGKKS